MMSANLLLLWNSFRYRRLVTVSEQDEKLHDFQLLNYFPFLTENHYVKFTDLNGANLDFEKRFFDIYVVQLDLLTTPTQYYIYYDSRV